MLIPSNLKHVTLSTGLLLIVRRGGGGTTANFNVIANVEIIMLNF